MQENNPFGFRTSEYNQKLYPCLYQRHYLLLMFFKFPYDINFVRYKSYNILLNFWTWENFGVVTYVRGLSVLLAYRRGTRLRQGEGCRRGGDPGPRDRFKNVIFGFFGEIFRFTISPIKPFHNSAASKFSAFVTTF